MPSLSELRNVIKTQEKKTKKHRFSCVLREQVVLTLIDNEVEQERREAITKLRTAIHNWKPSPVPGTVIPGHSANRHYDKLILLVDSDNSQEVEYYCLLTTEIVKLCQRVNIPHIRAEDVQ